MFTKRFEYVDQSWLIEDRLNRMRYLINHLVWRESICRGQVGENWFVATNDSGQQVIPVWPDEEVARSVMRKQIEGLSFVTLPIVEIETKFLSKIHDDELLGVFPNLQLEYEMMTVKEFQTARSYAQLLHDGQRNTLTAKQAAEMKRFFTLRKR